jgi:hypothetical protein
MPIANVKTYSFGIKYKLGTSTVRATTHITKNIRVAPTRSIRAAQARQAAREAAHTSSRNRTSTDSLIVSGAGTPEVNGAYVAGGTLNGHVQYLNVNDPDVYIGFDGSKWVIAAAFFTVYAAGANVLGPYTNAGGSGVLPNPTVAFATVGSSAYVNNVEVTTPMLASQLRLLSVKRGLYKFATGMG